MNKLIYFSDPMCSWCYGFKPEIELLVSQFKDEFQLELVMGGLRPGGGDPWTDEFRVFLKNHWNHVHQASGQPFNYRLFEEPWFDYNTEPACRAVCIAKKIRPDLAFDFFTRVQHNFYAEGDNPTLEEFYKPILYSLNMDHLEFFALFRSEEGHLLARQDFEKTARYKIRGFPTVIAEIDDQLYPVSHGYSSFQMMKDRLRTLVATN